MNYTEILHALKKANLFDLYRLSVAIRHEMENPAHIEKLRQHFTIGDTITYFDEGTNSLQPAVVLKKKLKIAVSIQKPQRPEIIGESPTIS